MSESRESGDEVTKLAANHVNISLDEVDKMGPEEAQKIIRSLSGSVLSQHRSDPGSDSGESPAYVRLPEEEAAASAPPGPPKVEALSAAEFEFIRKLRDRGFAISIFYPEEMGKNVSRKEMEDAMAASGNNLIQLYAARRFGEPE